jgi:CDP-diacylglycerol--glycerol-3-phosphate 3-phosphatidyltransferase
MASIYNLKSAFQNLLRPLTKLLARNGVMANHVTSITIILSFILGGMLFFWINSRYFLLLVPVFLFCRMALNAIDGMLAREHNMKSSVGAILNELGDVACDAVLYLPFALLHGVQSGLIVAIVVLGIISEMAGVVAIQIGAARRYDGPMGKSDRAFVFGTAALVLGLGVPPGTWLTVVLWIVLILLILTVLNRCRNALRNIER